MNVRSTPSSLFSGAIAGDLEASARGVSHILSLYFVIVLLSIFFVSLVFPSVATPLYPFVLVFGAKSSL